MVTTFGDHDCANLGCVALAAVPGHVHLECPPVFPRAQFRVLGAAGGPDLDQARAAGTTMAWGLGVVVLRTEQWAGTSLWAG